MLKEEILAVPREKLFGDGYFEGVIEQNMKNYIMNINKNYKFFQRRVIENKPEFKQIIPYQLVRFQNKYLLLRRFNTQGEKRLHHKYSLGIGGHLIREDVKENDNFILKGAKREFQEEIDYKGKYKYKLVCLLNCEKEEVDSVHFGIIYEVLLKSDCLEIKEKNKMEGKFLTLHQIKKFQDEMEGWSKIIMENILS